MTETVQQSLNKRFNKIITEAKKSTVIVRFYTEHTSYTYMGRSLTHCINKLIQYKKGSQFDDNGKLINAFKGLSTTKQSEPMPKVIVKYAVYELVNNSVVIKTTIDLGLPSGKSEITEVN